MPNTKGNCSSCRFHGLQAPEVCALYGVKKPDDGYCDQHKYSELLKCDLCGTPMVPSASIIDNKRIICVNCFSKLRTCQACTLSNTCAFQTDPSPIPQMVNKQIRQGNMITVAQVMNPDRVRITCEKGCKCYSKENGCLKQIGTCANYKEV